MMKSPLMQPLKYLSGYPPHLLTHARQLIEQGRLRESVAKRYGQAHDVRTDRALYDYVAALKSQFLRNAEPLATVAQRARRSAEWLGEDVLRRSVPLAGRMRLKERG